MTKSQARAKLEEHTPAPRYLPLQTIAVEIAAGETEASKDRVFGLAANVSETGACVIVNRAIRVDATIELHFVVEGRSREMTIRARVVWCAERLEKIKEIVGHLVGVAFADSPERVQEMLSSGAFQPVP